MLIVLRKDFPLVMKFAIVLLAAFPICLPVSAQAGEPVETPAETPVEIPVREINLEEGMRSTVIDTTGAGRMIEQLESAPQYEPLDDPLLSDDGMKLNARDAVAMALERNPRVRVSEADVDAAWARVQQAKSQHLPQVNAQAAHVWNERIRIQRNFRNIDLLPFLGGIGGTGAGGGGVSADPAFIAPLAIGIGIQRQFFDNLQPDDQNDRFTLSVQQVIYAGGRISAAINASEHLARSQEWQRTVTLDTLEFQTKQAFFDCLLAQALLRVADASVTSYERNKSDAEQLFDVGMVSKFEVLRSTTELRTRTANRVRARNALKLALANLRRLIGVPHDTPLALEGQLDWFPYLDPVEKLVEEAYLYRPELLALEQTIMAADEDLRQVKAAYKPQIAANAEYMETTGAPTVPDGWLFTIGANWEITAGGRRRAERAERRARIRSTEAQLEDLRQLVELEVTQARIQIEDAIYTVMAERGTVELAREALSIAELRFQEGVGTQTDILDSELALTNAETSLVRALRDFAVANAALERAIGKSWYRTAGLTELELPAE